MQVFFKAGDGYSDVYGVAWPLREDTKQVSPHGILRHGSASLSLLSFLRMMPGSGYVSASCKLSHVCTVSTG